jgi:hypothetical protein
MDLNALRAFGLELIWHLPAAFVDLVNDELPGEPLQPDPQTSQLCREVKSEIGDVDDTFVKVRGSEMAFCTL